MLQVLFLTLSACALFPGLLAKDINITIPPKTVKTLQLDAYMGRWYQMYTSFIPVNTYEKDLVCIVNDFSPMQQTSGQDPNKVSFQALFSANNLSTSGELVQSKANATNTQFSTQPGKWMVKMDLTGTPWEDDYASENSSDKDHEFPNWIVALGDMDANKNQYPWAVVSVPLGIDLFILARDITEFQSKYEDQVLKMVHDKGFKYVFNKPIKTFQSTTECKYPAAPAPPTPPTPPTPPATA